MNCISNFKKDILEATAGDTIIAVKILYLLGDMRYAPDDKRDTLELKAVIGKPISFEFALSLLDYSYDYGYGGPDCHDILMWSDSFVYYINEYDGSTAVCKVPRNPI